MNHPLDKLVRSTLSGRVPLFIFIAALFSGVLALYFTPREEEPQIVVPMVDVLVSAPGLSAKQIERQVTTPLEKLLAQIPGVEHIYSSSLPGQASVTLRFYVGEDREISILNTYNKLYSNQDKIPPVVQNWLIKPVEVDDVPIMVLALWSDNAELYNDYELRRLAEDVSTYLQGIPQTSEVNVVGGRPRTIKVSLKPESMAARKTTVMNIISALQASNRLQDVAQWRFNNESILLESGDFIRSVEDLERLVVNVVNGIPVYLQDLATVEDGPAEAETYTWLDFGLQSHPSVSISVAKQRGSDAVRVAANVHEVMQELDANLFPPEIQYEVLRDYGETANSKVNNLTGSLGFSVLTVVIFISVFLGWRPALVVGLAVPVCYGVTLALDMALGYTINRVTLFALILSLGLLVDDPITGVDNISRYLGSSSKDFKDRITAAISEIRTPLLISTLTIVLAFLPLAFITGMMGPYMAPMAFNVPVSVITSTLVAFFVTPWLTSKLLKPAHTEATSADDTEGGLLRMYRRLLTPLLDSRKKSKLVLWLVMVLFMGACLLPALRLVPLKLLPFDNKNEIQIVIDMPENSSLEQTAAMARRISAQVTQLAEVSAVAAYVGLASPIDFNGMVRRYYQRNAPYMAELRLILVDKEEREHQSHGVVLRIRELLGDLSQQEESLAGLSIKVIEAPPGPPVLSTLVAEVYGNALTDYDVQRQAAQTLVQRLQREPHVVEVDSTVEAEQQRLRFVLDKQKAALSGISTEDINQTLTLVNSGYQAGYLPLSREAKPLPIELKLAQDDRTSLSDFNRLQVKGQAGIIQNNSDQGLDSAPQPLVAIGEIGEFIPLPADTSIHHKDLKPVVYVMAELSGRTPAEIVADVGADQGQPAGTANDWQQRHFFNNGGGDGWDVPEDIEIEWGGEGEWKITIDVFRDMGLAFAFALVAIYIVLRIQTASTALSLIIMSAIPLTVIGIMPGFWLLNQFGEREIAGAPEPILFTATAMIGMIALAGIVVRNSVILIEFITQARATGLSMKESLIQAGAIRMRPILLTAGTTLLGNLVIILDPVFSGLALAIIFGIIASTLFTLIVVPVVYLLVFDKTAAVKEAPHV